jgi:hypothetical protein
MARSRASRCPLSIRSFATPVLARVMRRAFRSADHRGAGPTTDEAQTPIVDVAGHGHNLSQSLDRAVAVASSRINLGESFQHQRAVVNMF